MKMLQVQKGVVAAACAFALSMCLTACSGSSDDATSSAFDTADTSGGVAATVNGTEIGENAVTTYIENFRMNNGLTDEASWAQWLVDYDYTIESLRAEIIDYFAEQELIRQAAAENGISVDEDVIDQQIESMRANYDADSDGKMSDEEQANWLGALSSVGIGSEEQYRSMLELFTLEAELEETVVVAEDPSEEDLLMYAQLYSSLYDGAKRSSHILFAPDDQQTAQEVLDKINSGELDFAEAAKQYSLDTSAENGGDVGWDKATTFVEEYQTALDGLEKGEVSGLVTSPYGIHIIMCTDEYIAPAEVTSTDQVPAEWMDGLYEQMAEYNKQSAYQEWFQSYHDGADIVINDMPEGLSYAVDLTGYTPSPGSVAEQNSAAAAETAPDGTPYIEDEGEGPEGALDEGYDGPTPEDEAAPEGDAAADAAGEAAPVDEASNELQIGEVDAG